VTTSTAYRKSITTRVLDWPKVNGLTVLPRFKKPKATMPSRANDIRHVVTCATSERVNSELL